MCNNFYKEFLKEKKGITAFIRNFLRKKMCNNCYKEFLKERKMCNNFYKEILKEKNV